MDWIRGEQVGRGSFGTINLAIPKPSSSPIHPPPPLMVVKSADFSNSDSLMNEREVLRRLGACQQIVRCFGDARTTENGRDFYNLFFEYAAVGSLADRLKSSPGNRFSDSELRRCTNSILKGLDFIHDCGFVHCDIKLQNVLQFADGGVKISDFGLAKERRNDKKRDGFELRGTPLYMALEVVAGGEVDAPADVWALGCAVVEMATGKPAWRCDPGCGVGELLCRIAAAGAAPEIPESMSEDGRDFLSKCFAKDPNERWTARMLLGHPFVSGLGEAEESATKTTSSPRDPFEFAEWTPTASYSPEWEHCEEPCSASVLNRVDGLAGDPVSPPDWSDSDGWVTIRSESRVDDSFQRLGVKNCTL